MLFPICVLNSAITEVLMSLPRWTHSSALKTEAAGFCEAFDICIPNYTASLRITENFQLIFAAMRSSVSAHAQLCVTMKANCQLVRLSGFCL
jgi:hypothetical protein